MTQIACVGYGTQKIYRAYECLHVPAADSSHQHRTEYLKLRRLSRGLAEDHLVETGPHAFEGNLHLVTVLQPQLGLSTHANPLRSRSCVSHSDLIKVETCSSPTSVLRR